MNDKGIVYLVGAGPGEQELITVKGLRLLQSCEVVMYDRLASSSLVDEAPLQCERINVGKRLGDHTYMQDEINKLLVQKALEGKRIVRLKGGDPFVFGRGGEEILALEEAGIPYEVIPGVTSATSAPLSVGVPVTHRGISQSFHVVTGYTISNESGMIEDLNALARLKGTLVFLMGMSHLAQLTEKLIQYGKSGDTPACLISKGTTPYQRELRGTLKDIAYLAKQHQMEAPATLVIGETANMQLVYKNKSGLFKKQIALMMTEQLADKIAPPLIEQGANVVRLSGIKIEKNKLTREEIKTLEEIESYSWIIFTSSYGVTLFFQQLEALRIDQRRLSHVRFAVIGSGTEAALKKQGYLADYMPDEYTSIALAEGLSSRISNEARLLMPRAEKGSLILYELLKKKANKVSEVKLYDMVIDQKRLMQQLDGLPKVDVIIFGSSGGARGFVGATGERGRKLLSDSQIICIGEVTAKTLEELGFDGLHTAKCYSAEGVVQCIKALF